MKRRVLFLHGSADMYGSSKILISVVEAAISENIEPIIILPYSEKLDLKLADMGARVFVGPVAVLRRQNFNLMGTLKFIHDLWRSIIFIRKMDLTHKFDLVYSNTSAVLSGAFYARFFGKRHLWHIHEITTKPALFRCLMPFIINLFSDMCVAISHAVEAYLVTGGVRKGKVRTIYNGVAPLEPRGAVIPRAEDRVVVGMVGRFNRWKGQDILIRAASEIVKAGYGVDFLIVGSAFKNEEGYLAAARKLISELGIEKRVTISDFMDDLGCLYSAFDILVVPSVEPEPFGMVAIEAMSMKKPIIASRIGALPEIVVDGETGILFDPGNPAGLKDAILKLALDKGLRNTMGEKGFERQRRSFGMERFRREIVSALSAVMA